MNRYARRGPDAEITIYCPRECEHGPCEDEIVLGFTAEPYVPARIYGLPEHCSPAEGGERELYDVIPRFCSRLHLFTNGEQRVLEVDASTAMYAYDFGADAY